ncbi:uncharacterized protein LOC135491154 isoform X2 [Lineus longissimus]
MATKRKADDVDTFEKKVFIFNTSPLKRSSRTNRDYFNAVCQTDKDEYIDTVCFKTNLHQQFRKAELERTPVKLENVNYATSYNKPNTKNLKLTYLSSMSPSKQQISFRPKPPKEEETQTIKLGELEKINNFQKVNTVAKIMDIKEDTITKDVWGKSLDMKVLIIADETGCTHLTVWGSLIPKIKLTETYTLKDLGIREYTAGLKTLTTSPSTTVETYHEVLDTVTIADNLLPNEQKTTIINGKIEQIQIVMKKTCRNARLWHQTRPTKLTNARLVICDNEVPHYCRT